MRASSSGRGGTIGRAAGWPTRFGRPWPGTCCDEGGCMGRGMVIEDGGAGLIAGRGGAGWGACGAGLGVPGAAAGRVSAGGQRLARSGGQLASAVDRYVSRGAGRRPGRAAVLREQPRERRPQAAAGGAGRGAARHGRRRTGMAARQRRTNRGAQWRTSTECRWFGLVGLRGRRFALGRFGRLGNFG